MPPASDAELQEAEQHLRSSGIKKRVTQPAIVTEVARRRIRRGDYGYQPTRITQAAVDLCLSERQKQELRQQLRDEVMPVRTLDSMFMAAATAQPAEPTVEVQFEEQLAARREMHTWLYFEEQVAEWHFAEEWAPAAPPEALACPFAAMNTIAERTACEKCVRSGIGLDILMCPGPGVCMM
jgi:hypothetical protein